MAEESGKRQEAFRLFQRAYEHQMRGDLERAVALYRESIGVQPTAEAHTFLGWTYSFQGKLDEAIAECQKAIQVDPDFGNPYNDIGAYLIEKERWDEAIPWFEKAMKAKRYESYAFPHLNLGRVWERKGEWHKAIKEYEEAMKANPNYAVAREAYWRLKGKLNGHANLKRLGEGGERNG